ncbi:flagellar M-ring protein FliF [Escherichia coli]|nr:flagellar M-ring protein FliF [Escherichia coli]
MNAQIKKLTQAFPAFPAFRLRLVDNKRWALMAGVGLAVAATAIIVSVLWTGNRGYVSLYGRQENLPVSQIVTVLDGEKLTYRIDPQSGQILVPEDALSKTRMTLAAKGVQAILPSGYELMDKDEVLGSSQFVQNVRYKRSLEGELAQSIMSLDAVESARVHLALNEESSFVVSDEPQNSASVVVRLHYGAKLNMDQVNAIVHLVSGSIPGLQASKVSVVDQAGNLLTDGIGAGEAVSAATRKRDQILKDIQDKTRASVANVLDSLVGTGNYRVSVMPDLDLSTIDETQEHYGDAPKINREESVLDSDTNQVAMGVPGSLSNRPPIAANQMSNGTEENRSPEALSKHSESKRDYSYDRSVQHIQHPDFAVKRLNVAVVLNQNAPALKNWKPEQTTQLTALLNNAAGIDAQRGDNLTLSLLNFVPQVAPVEPVIPLWKDDSVLAWVRLIGCGLLALLLLLFVVRPVMKRLTAVRAPVITSEPEAVSEPWIAMPEEERKNVDLPSLPGDDSLPSQSSGLEVKLEFLQKLAMSELTTNKSNSYLEQAAILLLCLGEEAAATVMQKLSREEVVRLSENMARLSGVKTSMARKVINNFFDEFREQSGINGASRSMLQGILNKALGTEIASSVINGIYGDEIRSRMARLQWVEPRQLAMLISEEHLQLQAVFLAFLTPEISAAVLSYLNESVQNEILYRVAKLNDVNRDVVDELDRLIERGLSVLSEHGSKVKGIKQAADIVNRFQGNQQVILDQMRERDEEVLGQIQDEMYDFFILSRQNEEVRRRLLDEVPMEDWAVALKGTEALLHRSIYAVMPKRQAQQLEAITARLGPVPVSRIEQIRREIMGIARELEEAGEIQLQLFAERTAE